MKIKKNLLSPQCRMFVALLCLLILFEWPVWSAPQAALSFASTNQVAVATVHASPNGLLLTQTSAQPQVAPPKCGIVIILFVLLAIAFLLWAIYKVCQAAGLCGPTGSPPPQSPTNAPPNNVRSTVATTSIADADLVNSNVTLPATIFYLSNGVIVSNSAGLSSSLLPPLVSFNGQAIPNGSQIDSPAPGITTPPSIALWMETNTFYDANLDATYPYVVVYNYSLLTTTNLAAGWQEACTVIGWANDNPTVPLIFSITYTNGVAMTTNWTQFYLDQNNQPTNFVVYGALPSLPLVNPPANFSAVRPADSGPPIPPGGGGGTNATPFSSNGQFFRLTCNTNAIVAQWPY